MMDKADRLEKLALDEPLPESERRKVDRFVEGKRMESTAVGSGTREKSPAGSSPAPSANSEITEEWIRDNTDMYTRTVQVASDELTHILGRLRKAERVSRHVKEHMDLLMNSLWEAQQAYDKLRDELGLNPLVDPTEDTLRDVPRLENEGSGVRIPGLPPERHVMITDIIGPEMARRIQMVTGLTKLPVPVTYNVRNCECPTGTTVHMDCGPEGGTEEGSLYGMTRSIPQADGAEPIGEDDGCNPLEEGSIPSGTSINKILL